MPIVPRESISGTVKEIIFVEPVRTVSIRFNGKNAYNEALAFMFEFFGKSGCGLSAEGRRVFAGMTMRRQAKMTSDARCI